LLGPNGAGKTTTIGIMTGFIPSPTSGDLFVSGHSIHGSRELIRPLIGVCTQNDILWDDLTVQEHLNFQCRQKGFPTHLISAEVQKVATRVSLDGDSFKTQAKQLSGGMKRRLSI
ncbi:unnamed protein product, partial [Sphagnum compactum]